ncbi:MAG TPA: hypothetical protein VLM85_18535 [Polyangiaceae bacterium]|nr:hypothetical protein [Polyangiaceae bacterium]
MSDPFRSDLEAARQRIEHLEAEHEKRVGELEEENRRLRARLVEQQPQQRRRSPARVVLPVAMVFFGASLAGGMLFARGSRPAADVPLPGPLQVQELPTIGGGADDVAFDRRAAADVLGGVRVQDCAPPGGPHGTGRVKITFAPSGVATKAELEQGIFAQTKVGECIVGRYLGARVPPFSGGPITVEKSFDVAE